MSASGPFEQSIRETGRELIERAREHKQRFWAREHWEEQVFRRLMEQPAFRTQLLRFIDVLPDLQTDAEVARHLDEYLGGEELALPEMIKWGVQHVRGAAAAHVAGLALRAALHQLARRFIGGTTPEEFAGCLNGLRARRLAASIDLLGESTVSVREAEAYARRYLEALHELGPMVARWEPVPVLDQVNGRAAPRLNVSIKLSSLFPLIEPAAPDAMASALKTRVTPIVLAAKEAGAFVCFDMEHYNLKEITLRVFREVFAEPEFAGWPDVGIALQAYLREAEDDLSQLIDWAGHRGTPATVRLVRGAYWDEEQTLARQHEWTSPVWETKAETDACYERCLEQLLRAHPVVEAGVATHNVRSIALALALVEDLGLAPDAFEFQMLYGMADPLKDALAERGYRMRVYVPCGELLPGMAYLVRRMLENTASQSFLRMSFAEERPVEELLAPPVPAGVAAPERGAGNGAQAATPGPFRNEPVRRFTDPLDRQAFQTALAWVRGALGRSYPLVVGAERYTAGEELVSVNPAKPGEVVGRVSSAQPKDVDAAVSAATAAWPSWKSEGFAGRAEVLLQAAGLLRRDRDRFAAWEVLEAGKPWREADADVTEAIDYLEYYAREALRYGKGQVLDVPGETNRYHYIPRGVVAVISPWNFPLAIPVGMLSAAVVAGNPVVFKPAPQTPVLGALLVDMLQEAGVPPGVVQFIPGRDEAIGDYLVRHPGVHLIAFTGSREVGTRIRRLAAEGGEGQRHVKQVIGEMGGKNAIMIDQDAELDEAVPGVLASAFGYAGQKCSAASRLIVHEAVYDRLVERLVEATGSLRIGDPADPATFMGPVIDEEARTKIGEAIAEAQTSARLLAYLRKNETRAGYFVGPAVVEGVPVDHPLAQEEIFGPVLLVFKVADLSEALAVANATPYALTGGIYSRTPSHIERARLEFEVGNLYINRGITGAIVGRQPFGGFKMSGIGSKAGGPDYLLQYLQPRTVTENLARRGFVPSDTGEPPG